MACGLPVIAVLALLVVFPAAVHGHCQNDTDSEDDSGRDVAYVPLYLAVKQEKKKDDCSLRVCRSLLDQCQKQQELSLEQLKLLQWQLEQALNQTKENNDCHDEDDEDETSSGDTSGSSSGETSGDETSGDETSGDETSGDETSGDETSEDETSQDPDPEYFNDCKHAYDNGSTTSGVYTIQPDDGIAFPVYCDMETDGGGWTVIQRRADGAQNFFKEWDYYVAGFGTVTRDHWLGLENIYRLLSAHSGSSQLRVEIRDAVGDSAYVRYSSFAIGDSSTKYTLLGVGSYSGPARDSLSYHIGQKFSTKDQDNDSDGKNCAEFYYGAWWYKSCYNSNLNGPYRQPRPTSRPEAAIVWYSWRRNHDILKFSEMKIRRR